MKAYGLCAALVLSLAVPATAGDWYTVQTMPGHYGYGAGYGYGGCPSCDGSTWGFCEYPRSYNLHLWDTYCAETARCAWCGHRVGGVIHALFCKARHGCGDCCGASCGDSCGYQDAADAPVEEDDASAQVDMVPPAPADSSAAFDHLFQHTPLTTLETEPVGTGLGDVVGASPGPAIDLSPLYETPLAERLKIQDEQHRESDPRSINTSVGGAQLRLILDDAVEASLPNGPPSGR